MITTVKVQQVIYCWELFHTEIELGTKDDLKVLVHGQGIRTALVHAAGYIEIEMDLAWSSAHHGSPIVCWIVDEIHY